MSTSRSQIQSLVVSLGVSLTTLVVMLLTEPSMAIGWDEGYTLGREARLRDWFRGLRDPAGFAALWRPLPQELELVQEADKTPSPTAISLIHAPSCSPTRSLSRGSGRSRGKSRTAIRRSTRCSAWLAMFWRFLARSTASPAGADPAF